MNVYQVYNNNNMINWKKQKKNKAIQSVTWIIETTAETYTSRSI